MERKQCSASVLSCAFDFHIKPITHDENHLTWKLDHWSAVRLSDGLAPR